jgi:preprotein translocase subunit SecA
VEGLAELVYEVCHRAYLEKAAAIGDQEFRKIERYIMLQTVDNLWKDHLLSMDHLKEGIGMRAYAQQNPLLVYKKEGFDMFQGLMARIKEETLGLLFRIQLADPDTLQERHEPKEQDLVFSGSGGGQPIKKKPVQRTHDKVGRNDPCPCGSGKKYKKCCGR